MKTLGVDLAAATRKTAAAVIEWASGGYKGRGIPETERLGLILGSLTAAAVREGWIHMPSRQIADLVGVERDTGAQTLL